MQKFDRRQIKHRFQVSGPGRVFVSRGGKPQLWTIVLGLADGIATEVLSGNLFEGNEVIIDMDRLHSLGRSGHEVNLVAILFCKQGFKNFD